MRVSSRIKKVVVAIIACVFTCASLNAEETPPDPVSIELLSENTSIQPGETFWLLVHYSIQPDWHLYWLNPGETGQAPKVNLKVPSGFTVGDIEWPAPSFIESHNNLLNGYSDELSLLIPIKAPEKIKDTSITIEGDTSYVVCSTLCIPGKAKLNLELPVSEKTPEKNAQAAPLFQKTESQLPRKAEYSVAGNDVSLEINIKGQKPFSGIQEVFFFPLEKGVFPVNIKPKFNVMSGNLLVTLPTPKGKYKRLQGVLVVEFQGQKKAFSIDKEIAFKALSEDPLKFKGTASQEEKIEEEVPAVTVYSNKALETYAKANTWVHDKITEVKAVPGLNHILLLAFIGGIILNLMPCVLPVVSLKVLQFVQMKGQRRFDSFRHGLSFFIGVILCFWILAALMIVLQSLGKTVGWGFQLQEPLFVATLILILFLFSMSLFGVFEFGVKIASFAAELEETAKEKPSQTRVSSSYFSSFIGGVLATFVATPCTGPLLGSTLGFTATLEPSVSFVIFTAVGAGMAFPYLFLSIFPELLSLLPKPGPWLETFKQFMGFLMLVTVVWLIWVLQAETSDLSLLLLIGVLFVYAFASWIYGKWGAFDKSSLMRFFAKFISLCLIVGFGYLFFKHVNAAKMRYQEDIQAGITPKSSFPFFSMNKGQDWEPFSEQRLQDLRANNAIVFVDFTAKWCLTCHVNAIVLESPQVKEAFRKYGVVKLLADWTQGDETITKFLRSLGRNGVPVYALYYGKDKNKPPVLLPELLTPDIVISALEKAAEENKK